MYFDLKAQEYLEPSESDKVKRRLMLGLAISFLLHALLLSLQFGIPGLDLPSLQVPWKERRKAPDTLEVVIANPAPKLVAVPAVSTVTTAELFQFPDPVLPPPSPPTASGFTVVAAQSKSTSASVPPQQLPIPAPVASVVSRKAPSRVITQKKKNDSEFVVPLPDIVELKPDEKTELKAQQEAHVDNTLEDKKREQRQLEEQKQAESAAERAQEEARYAQQVKKAEQESIRREREAAAKVASEAALAAALETAAKDAQKRELLSQETLRQEEQRRQAEQKQQYQLVQEQERKQALAQAQLKQKALEEQMEKKKALELAERLRTEELEQQKIAERQVLEKKLQEKKLQEQKLAEQKLAEQKLAEQKLAEQKLAEQRIADQKLAEQKLAEQKLADQRIADQKLAEQKLAQARANAQATTAAVPSATVVGNGNGIVQKAASNPFDAPTQDLAQRLREQARNRDLLKASPSTSKKDEESRARRRSFLGAYDKEVPLRMYVDSLKQKLERNGNLIYEKRSLSDAEFQLVVKMIVRSDGTVEEVMIIKSSGYPALDERAKNIILTNAPFSIFPATLAAKYDVIEIQRLWIFGDKLRILEDLR
ncbi:MAG: TonB C-terminal domain-containing protein [Undibacterium sp.]|nr:TonB C-terminal domain-containing protein [Undibacterium sp.]